MGQAGQPDRGHRLPQPG